MRTLSKARTLAAPQRRSFIDWMTNYPDKVCTKGCCCVLCVVCCASHSARGVAAAAAAAADYVDFDFD
jgi:hypothetical protein